ncbi:MATE family efflux transporter [Roseicella aerolata]|uniref:Multidrug-efflux transporter n=1 Tax=Roseicella aerolata TaxID=2883479 RepID=A0A9X1IHF8_9PROT|nr:MATE family efflux transporter [Roseicella aerolata]MCB4824640.1 MATE family efflux transporter [Roseicella aerolata]
MVATTRTGQGGAWGAEARATLALAWPLALTNLSQHALALTDAIILGWFSTEALAAATLGANLYWAVMAAPLGTALAATPILAQARGAGRLAGGEGRGWVRQMRRGAQSALWASLAMLLPAMLLLWFAEAVLLALGQEPGLAALAGAYVRCLMWGLLPFCAFVVLRGFLAAMERPAPALWIAVGAIGVNAALDWLLVFGAGDWPGLGVVGAGIASSLANTLMVLGLLALIARDRVLGRFRLLGRMEFGAGRSGAPRPAAPRPADRLRPDWSKLREVMRIGLPISGTMLLEIGVFSAAAIAMGWFGAIAIAAHAIALQVAATTFMVPMGIAQAATARVGLFAGAGEGPAAARAGWVAVALGAGFMAAMALLLVSSAGPVAWAFLDAADPRAAEAAALGAVLLTIAGLFQLADGVQAVAAGALRGLKDTRVPMLLAALGYWGLGMPIGLSLAEAAGLGPTGLWIGLAVGIGAVALLMLRRWWRLSRAAPGMGGAPRG